MKKSALLLIIATPFFCVAQNVGIGTTTPQSTLDVKGNQRIGGNTKFLEYDSLSGKFTWKNSNLWVTESQYLIQHSASAEGLFYGNGNLLYRGVNDTAFMTNWNTGRSYIRERLGIGTKDPVGKLHIFYGNSNVSGIAPNLTVESDEAAYIGIFTPSFSEAGLLFSNEQQTIAGAIIYNNPSNIGGLEFRLVNNTTKLVIRSDGRIMFDNTIGERITFYTHTATEHYGIGITGGELKLHAATASDAIVFGHGTTADFNETARIKGDGSVVFTGALMPDGSAGTSGQVLLSNGNDSAPVWTTKFITTNITIDFGLTGPNSNSDLNIFVAEAAPADAIIVNPPAQSTVANSCYTASIMDYGQVSLRFNNYGSTNADPSIGIFKFTIIKNQ